MFDPTPQVLKKIEVAVPRKTSVEAENLRRARKVIQSEENWCVGSRNNVFGQRCALGALDAVGVKDIERYGFAGESNREVQLLAAASRDLFPTLLSLRGDSTTASEWRVADTNNMLGHAATMAMFNRAIELAEQESAVGS